MCKVDNLEFISVGFVKGDSVTWFFQGPCQEVGDESVKHSTIYKIEKLTFVFEIYS